MDWELAQLCVGYVAWILLYTHICANSRPVDFASMAFLDVYFVHKKLLVKILPLEIIFSQQDSTNTKYFYGVIIFTKTNRILALKRPQRHVNDPATMLIFTILR